jgi:hypothetical protein
MRHNVITETNKTPKNQKGKVMWANEILTAEGSENKYEFCVKHFEESSRFGINQGKVSILTIRKVGENCDLVNFSRG